MFLYPYKEEFDSVNNRKLTNGYDIIVTTTYCDFKKSSNKFEDDSCYKSTKSEILIQFWMHKDCAKELLEVNIQCFRKREKNIFYGMYILGVKKKLHWITCISGCLMIHNGSFWDARPTGPLTDFITFTLNTNI